jgi:dTDP-4-amino-4,6-dideoxygalactose transaminase
MGWRRYSIFAGTNTLDECLFALAALRPGWDHRQGAVIARFEREFAEAAGCSEGVSFASCRMGLFALLKGMGIGPGDEVMLPAYSCVVVPNAIRYAGVTPVYVDIELKTLNLDLQKARAALSPRTKAIIVQHTFGKYAEIREFVALAREHKLLLIEDCAHALGSKGEGGQVAGSLGDAAIFSLDHSKVVNCHLGGMVTTNSPRVAAALRAQQAAAPFLPDGVARRILFSFVVEYLVFRPALWRLGRYLQAALRRLGLVFFFLDELSLAKPTAYPYPARLAAGQAAIGLKQLAKLPENLRHRRRVADAFQRALDGRLLPSGAGDNHLRCSLLVKDRDAAERIFSPLFAPGMTWFTSIAHGRQRDFESIGYRPGRCPVAESLAKHIINFPTHPQVDPGRVYRFLQKQRPAIDPHLLSPDAASDSR